MEKNYEFLIGYHSNSNFECNTEKTSIDSLSIALGVKPQQVKKKKIVQKKNIKENESFKQKL